MSRFTASLASVLFAALAWPAHLLAKSGVRFVHAVPGAREAELTVEQAGRTTLVGRTGYGRATDVRTVPPGEFRWRLASGGKTIAEGTGTAASARMTAVAIPQGTKPVVRFFRDAVDVPRGKARLRVIHAAPELGSPDLRVDGKRVARGLGYGRATPYLTVSAGRHDLQAVRAQTNDELLSRRGVRVPANAVTTAFLIGTAGEPARIITVSDRVAAPRGQGAADRRGSRASGGSYTIRRGDSLWAIARQQLGDGASNARIARAVDRLWEANAARIGTGDPNLIFPGQRIRLV